ncbi:PAS domain-containing sensor histidine kinase [Bacteroidota bacterium]
MVFRKLRDEKESQYLYLQTIVEHINIAIICYTKNGKICMANTAAKKLFGSSHLDSLKRISHLNKNLYEQIITIKPDQNLLVKTIIKDELLNLSINNKKFKLLDETHNLLSIQNIKTELEEQEIESWQKLIRVINHEITNSTLPISNLTSILIEKLIDKNGDGIEGLDKSSISMLRDNLEIIKTRSLGLSNFVGATKSFTHLPKPKFRDININELIIRIINLFNPKFEENKIKTEFKNISQVPIIQGDSDLLEQVVINIFLNAIEALKETTSPLLVINCYQNEKNQTHIQFIDNGRGIKANELEKIFVPFYTTKKNGSGIGLSLSKQIMRLHKGSIFIESVPDEKTIVSLIL